jgi:cardiolipin synthase
MEAATSNSVTTVRHLALPNVLTYARIAAVPVVAACLYWQDVFQGGLWLRLLALAIFIAAAVTDFFDGYFARKWGEQSTFGRMLDPIADKLLVSSVLLMLAADGTIRGWSLWAAIVILCREILVSGLREYLAGLRVSVPVTALAKWKTTLQLVAVGFLIAGDAGDQWFPGVTIASISLGDFGIFFRAGAVGLITFIGLTLLWLSAVLTLYTGWDYFRAGMRHLKD